MGQVGVNEADLFTEPSAVAGSAGILPASAPPGAHCFPVEYLERFCSRFALIAGKMPALPATGLGSVRALHYTNLTPWRLSALVSVRVTQGRSTCV